MDNLPSLLGECKDLPDVFEVVKKAVRETLGQRRAGLMLGLSDLPLWVAAYYVVGSNIIVINENLYNRVMGEKPEMINTWSFRVLLHEYLHSLGYQSESEVRELVNEISGSLLELDIEVPDYELQYFPNRGRDRNRGWGSLSDTKIKLIEGFDRSNTRYIT